MTPESNQITSEDDHYGKISLHKLVPLSPAKYTKYYVHIY